MVDGMHVNVSAMATWHYFDVNNCTKKNTKMMDSMYMEGRKRCKMLRPNMQCTGYDKIQ